jgi:hypothetical protein
LIVESHSIDAVLISPAVCCARALVGVCCSIATTCDPVADWQQSISTAAAAAAAAVGASESAGTATVHLFLQFPQQQHRSGCQQWQQVLLQLPRKPQLLVSKELSKKKYHGQCIAVTPNTLCFCFSVWILHKYSTHCAACACCKNACLLQTRWQLKKTSMTLLT